MKRITNLLSLITSIFIISACSTAYPNMIDSITVYNLNFDQTIYDKNYSLRFEIFG